MKSKIKHFTKNFWGEGGDFRGGNFPGGGIFLRGIFLRTDYHISVVTSFDCRDYPDPVIFRGVFRTLSNI